MKKANSDKLTIMIAVNIAALIMLCAVIFGSPEKEVELETPDSDTPVATEPVYTEPENSDNTTPSEPEPESLTLSIYSDYITVGTSMKIEIASVPSDALLDNVTWTSNNSDIVSVAADGTVTGISRGSTIITASTPNGVYAAKEIFVMNPGLVFLSPSRQLYNHYFDRTTTEYEQAYLMSGFCKQRLEAVGLEVYECNTEPELEERGIIAARMDAKCYVAIHTNAGGIEQGTMSFFNRRSEASIRLANAVYETVSLVTPDKDSGIKNGVKGDGNTYKEVQYPYEAGVPSTLLEVDYHDKEESARWLMNNHEVIGIAIADGIMHFMYENY